MAVAAFAAAAAAFTLIGVRHFRADARRDAAAQEAISRPAPGRQPATRETDTARTATAVAGRVVDLDGDPVAEATVRLWDAGRRAFLETPARAGPDGRFRVPVPPHRLFAVTALAPNGAVGFAFRVVSGREDLVLRVSPGVRRAIRVVDDETDRPLPDARVRAKDQYGNVASPRVTRAGDEWLLSGVAAGRAVTVRVTCDGYLPAGDIWIPRETETIRVFRLRRGLAMTIRCRDGSGRPVDAPGLSCRQGSRTVAVKELGAGRYRAEGLEPDKPLVVVANRRDPLGSTSRHEVVDGGTIDLRANPPGNVILTGVPDGHRPRAVRDDAAFEGTRVAPGRWRFAGIQPGKIGIALLLPDEIVNGFAARTVVEVVAGETVEAAADAPSAAALEGFVARPPECGAALTLSVRVGTRTARARVDERGRFSISAFPKTGDAVFLVTAADGSYLLRVERTLPLSGPVVLRGLAGDATIAGRVTAEPDGRAVPGASVELVGHADGLVERRRLHADGAGRFRFERTLDGALDIVVTQPGFYRRARRTAVGADGDLEFRLKIR